MEGYGNPGALLPATSIRSECARGPQGRTCGPFQAGGGCIPGTARVRSRQEASFSGKYDKFP